MTKHTDEFLQFAAPVTCRECILPRHDKSTDPKGCIHVNRTPHTSHFLVFHITHFNVARDIG